MQLKYKRLAAGVLLAITAGVCFAALALCKRPSSDGFFESPPTHPIPSFSIAESKARGRFQTAVSFDPRTVAGPDGQIEIDEMWIERAMQRERSSVGFVRDKPIGGYFLCFTIKKGRNLFPSPNGNLSFFVLDDKGNPDRWRDGPSFASINLSEIFWKPISAIEDADTRLYLLESWNSPRTESIRIRPIESN
jgi:hypothetical protein